MLHLFDVLKVWLLIDLDWWMFDAFVDQGNLCVDVSVILHVYMMDECYCGMSFVYCHYDYANLVLSVHY